MFLLQPPGVYGPQSDTALLSDVLRQVGLRVGARVLDVGTGTGALAVEAVRAGAREVLAVDTSRRAVLTARFNARARRLPIRVERGDALRRVAGRTFDVILANPPYVPSPRSTPSRRDRAWDAGPDGRALLDPLCRRAGRILNPGGMLLVVHSAVAGTEATLSQLRGAGLDASVVARRWVGFGPVMHKQAAFLRQKGLVHGRQTHEELVVIRGDRRG